jgi:hypothetical protein
VDTHAGLMSASDMDIETDNDKDNYVGGDAATHTRDGLPIRACASDFEDDDEYSTDGFDANEDEDTTCSSFGTLSVMATMMVTMQRFMSS